MGEFSAVLVDRRELEFPGWMPVLSPREQEEVATYSNVVRRERTIASRIIAKYLLSNVSHEGFRRLAPAEIHAARTSDWASIELLSGTSRRRTGMQIFRSGAACPNVSVSASHSGPYTAFVFASGRAGVDLERVEKRRKQFYANMFSLKERAAAVELPEDGRHSRDAGFTLLWTIKEAFLKAAPERNLSVWDFPKWTVHIDCGIAEALRECEAFYSGAAILSGPECSDVVRISTLRVDDMILTVCGVQKAVFTAGAAEGRQSQ